MVQGIDVSNFQDNIMLDDSIMRNPAKLPCNHIFDLGTLVDHTMVQVQTGIYSDYYVDQIEGKTCPRCRNLYQKIKVIQPGEQDDLITKINQYMAEQADKADEEKAVYVTYGPSSFYVENKDKILEVAEKNNNFVSKENLVRIKNNQTIIEDPSTPDEFIHEEFENSWFSTVCNNITNFFGNFFNAIQQFFLNFFNLMRS